MAPLPVDLAVGLAFLGAGIAAWRQRPRKRIGPLMILTAVAWFGQHVAEISTNLFLALIAHQVLVFPGGVTRDRLERALVWISYALAIVGYIVSEIWTATNEPLATLAIPLLLAILFVVVRRWLLASPPERRALEPIVWAGPPVLIVASIAVAHDYLDVGSSAVDWLKLVYIAIPLAFLAGVLRTQLSRAAVGALVVELDGASSPEAIRDALARSRARSVTRRSSSTLTAAARSESSTTRRSIPSSSAPRRPLLAWHSRTRACTRSSRRASTRSRSHSPI